MRSHKSAAPAAFSSTFSRSSNSKELSDDLLLPLDCAFSLPFDESVSADKYYLAVGAFTGYLNIIYGGKNGNKFVMHLSSKDKLKKFVEEHQFITIDEKQFPIKKLVDPGFLLVLHNVVPHIPNFVIEDELRKTLRLKSPIHLSKSGMRDPRLAHILAYKREVYVNTEDKEIVPVFIIVSWKNIEYKIYVSFDSSHAMRCFQCGKEGHLSKDCSESPAQRRLEQQLKSQSLSSSVTEQVGISSPPSVSPPTVPAEIEISSSSPLQVSESNVRVDFYPTFSNDSDATTDLEKLEDENPKSNVSMNEGFPALPTQQGTPQSTEVSPPVPPSPPPNQTNPARPKRNSPTSESSEDERKKKKNVSLEDESSVAFMSQVEEILAKSECSGSSLSSGDVATVFKLTKGKSIARRKNILKESSFDLKDIKLIMIQLESQPGVPNNLKSRAIVIRDTVENLIPDDEDEQERDLK
ncbi:hypothetical protein WDU94_000618 [Cyamophila willieti]